ncbi:PAS domain S-box protein [Candidatus Atribacteria bacterium MT.SAG.1]|nr:PAS domain S-box protein [Candidatus Atribacteria bacterium MT.SAG.1]
MKDENKTKSELIKELKTLRKKAEKSALNDLTKHQQNEEKYPSFTKDILDASAVGIFILDADFKVVWINHSIEKYFGLQREKVIGKDKRQLIKKNIQHIFEDPDEFIRKVFATYDNNTYIENFECHVLPEGKRKERWLEYWSQPIKSGLYAGGRIEHYYDITEHKQAENTLCRRVKELATLLKISHALNTTLEMETVLQTTTDSAADLMGIESAAIYLFEGEELYLGATTPPLDPQMPETFRRVRLVEHPHIKKSVSSGLPVILADTATADLTPAERAISIARGLRTIFYVPILIGKRVMGILILGTIGKPRVISEAEIDLCQTMANLVAFSIQNASLHKNLLQHSKELKNEIGIRKQAEEKIKHLNLVLRAIRNVNQLIVREKDREKLIKGACENFTKTRGYYNTWIALLDEKGKLKTCAEAGIGKEFLPIVKILKKGELIVCGQKALKQQEVVTIKDPASTCLECPLIKQHSGRRAMTIRLECSGKVYGLMSVSIPAHITVDQEEQSLFKEVANDIAFGLHNIELDEERKQAEENLKNAKNELQIILDSVPAIIFYKDTEGRIVRANKTLANSLKIPVKDIIGKTTEELFPKEQAKKMRKDDREVIISGKPKRDIIQPYDTPEGIRWLITDKMPYKDKEGKVTGVISLSKDITVQRKAEQKLKITYQRLKKTMDAAIDTMSKIIEAKDPYTSNHQHRVCQLAVSLARELGIAEDKVEGIRIASLIHDIGKIGLPTEILSKPGKLSDIEFSLIKDHSQIGYDILKSIDFSYPIAKIVLQHHERLNGSGYPNNLKGDKIFPEAKIIGIADVVEAMSSFRPYRPALGIDAALEEISQNKGILYDPEVVDACLKLIKEKGFKFES